MLYQIYEKDKSKKTSPIFVVVFVSILVLAFLAQDTVLAADVPQDGLELNAAALEKAKNPASWDLMNEGVFNSVYLFFRAKCIEAQTLLIPVGMYLTAVLAIIQLCTTWNLFEGQLRVFELIKEAIRCSVVFAVIMNASVLTEGLIRGFEFIGAVASGLFTASQAVGADLWQNKYFSPSNVIAIGSNAMDALWNYHVTSPSGVIDKVILFFLGIAGYVGTVFIALQITLTTVEYYLFAGLGVALLPFSVLRYTQFLSSRIIQGVASFGVKMMVVYFMVGLVISLLNQVNQSELQASVNGLKMGALINFVLIYIVMGYLVWKLPSLVQGMISGSPQMEGNGMVSSAASFAAGAAAKSFGLAGRASETWKATKEGKDGGGDNATKKATEVSPETGDGNGEKNDIKNVTDKSGKSTPMNMSQIGEAAKAAMKNGGAVGLAAGVSSSESSSGGAGGDSSSKASDSAGASGSAGTSGGSGSAAGAEGGAGFDGVGDSSSGESEDVSTGDSGEAGAEGGGDSIAETGDSRGSGALPEGGIVAADASDTAAASGAAIGQSNAGAGTGAGSSGKQGNKGDRFVAAAKAYGAQVAGRWHETVAGAKSEFKSSAKNLASAAKNEVASRMTDSQKAALGKARDTAVSMGSAAVAAGMVAENKISKAADTVESKTKSMAQSAAKTVSDYVPTPMKEMAKAKAAEFKTKGVPAMTSGAQHVGRFAKSMAAQGVIHLPGVRNYYRGKKNAGFDRDMLSAENGASKKRSQISLPNSNNDPNIQQVQNILQHFDNQMSDLKTLIAKNNYVN